MAAPISTGTARVADPVLTTAARGFRKQARVSRSLFPIVNVGARGGKIVQFSADGFRKVDTARAPGATRARLEASWEGKNFALTQHAIDGAVPVEVQQEAAAVPGIDAQMVAVRMAADIVSLNVERDAASLATNTATYAANNRSALGGNDQWSADASDPAKAVDDARAKIRVGIGLNPNVLLVGEEVFEALRRHAKVIDQVKYTRGLNEAGGGTLVNEAALAAYFGVDRFVVGRAVAGAAGAFESVWGKNAVLAYSEVSSLAAMGSPSFGYTYMLNGYPIASPGHLDMDTDTWLYPYTEESTPVVAGAEAGYLFSTVVA